MLILLHKIGLCVISLLERAPFGSTTLLEQWYHVVSWVYLETDWSHFSLCFLTLQIEEEKPLEL